MSSTQLLNIIYSVWVFVAPQFPGFEGDSLTTQWLTTGIPELFAGTVCCFQTMAETWLVDLVSVADKYEVKALLDT